MKDQGGEAVAYPEEQYFLNTFIRKGRRERLGHELNDPKKRYRGLDRFSHGTEELIDHRKIRMQGEFPEKEFALFLSKHEGICLVLSSDHLMEGAYMPLKEAVPYAQTCMEAVLVIGKSFAILYGEVMKGGREKYLLEE